MNENLEELIKKNKGILRQLTALNNEMNELKGRVEALEKRNSCYPTKEEIKKIKVGLTDPE